MAQQQFSSRLKYNYKRLKEQQKANTPKGWNRTKCPDGWPGHPTEVNDAAAENIVAAADFTNSEFIQTSQQDGGCTRYAYKYVKVGNYRVCVVGHIHRDTPDSTQWKAGYSFIPGYEKWETPTSDTHVQQIISQTKDVGTWLDDERYPKLI